MRAAGGEAVASRVGQVVAVKVVEAAESRDEPGPTAVIGPIVEAHPGSSERVENKEAGSIHERVEPEAGEFLEAEGLLVLADADLSQQWHILDVHVHVGDAGPAESAKVELEAVVDVLGDGTERGESRPLDARAVVHQAVRVVGVLHHLPVGVGLGIKHRINLENTAHLDDGILSLAANQGRQHHRFAVLVRLWPLGRNGGGAIAEPFQKIGPGRRFGWRLRLGFGGRLRRDGHGRRKGNRCRFLGPGRHGNNGQSHGQGLESAKHGRIPLRLGLTGMAMTGKKSAVKHLLIKISQ